MAETALITPDAGFIREVMADGGGDLKKCFQCSTCSAACHLSPPEDPFPRRQMLHAQWGLRERLMSDDAVWLCYACGECTTRCPRGARPGDVLAAVRRVIIKRLAFPRFMGSAGTSPAGIALIAVVAVIIFGLMAAFAPPRPAGAPFEFAHVFPIMWLEVLFFALSGVVLVALIAGTRRLAAGFAAAGFPRPGPAALLGTLVAVARHDRFAQCSGAAGRHWGHLLMFWGFVLLATVGTIVGMGTMAGLMHTPLALTNPLKILANAGAVAFLVGTGLLLADRWLRADVRRHSTAYDWLPLLTLFGIALTGIAAEALRVAQAAPAMYVVYFVHLVLIFVLFVGAVYTKLAHAAYRTVALAFSSSVDHSRGVS